MLIKEDINSIGIDISKLKEYPSSYEAEKGILGGFLLDPSLLNEFIFLLSREDFFFENTRIIFEAIKKMHEENRIIDIITLEDELKKKDMINAIGGISFLILLQENVTVIAHVERYINFIKEKTFLRKIINQCSLLISRCYEQDDDGISSVVNHAEKIFLDIANKKKKNDFDLLDVWLKKSFDSLSQNNFGFNGVNGIPSGYFLFDEMTSGFQKGDLIIIAARPSVGKTSFGLCIARNAAEKNIEVAFISLEMSSEQIAMRLLSLDSHVKLFSIRSGNLSSDDWIKITNSASRLSSYKIYLDDSSSQTVLEIRSRVRKLKMEKNIKLLIVDYLQLIVGSNKRSENRQYEVSEISRALKNLAKELDIPIIALSQLSRGVESRVDKRPILSDLRDSGAIEQDADLIMFLYREGLYSKEEANDNAEVIVAKQRNGPTGKIDLKYIKEYTLFTEHNNY